MRRNRATCGTYLIVSLLGCELASPTEASDYVISDLGTLGGPTSAAMGINESGVVVGYSTKADASLLAFRWDHGIAPIAPLLGDLQSQAFDIADTGKIAVMSFALGEAVTNGILLDGGLETALSGFAARAVNESDVVVGQVVVTEPDGLKFERAAMWQNGVLNQLGTLGGVSSFAYAINDMGEVVGKSLLAGNQAWHAMLYSGGTLRDLGTLGGACSQAYGINNARQVVGVADTVSARPHAFLYAVSASGQVTSRLDLGTLDGKASAAYAINEGGVVVGSSGARAFQWAAGVMTDLNTLLPSGSGWVLEDARDINNQGWIVGRGKHNGQERAYMLAPRGPFIPAVSEWGIGVIGLVLVIAGTLILKRN